MKKIRKIVDEIVTEAGPGDDAAFDAISTLFSSMAQIAQNISKSSAGDERVFKQMERMAKEQKVKSADLRWINQRVSALKIATQQLEKRRALVEKYLNQNQL